MLTSWYLNKKGREVSIKARSPRASLAFIGQVTKHTTVKWPICLKDVSWFFWKDGNSTLREKVEFQLKLTLNSKALPFSVRPL